MGQKELEERTVHIDQKPVSIFRQEIIRSRGQYGGAVGTGSPYGVADGSGNPYRRDGGRRILMEKLLEQEVFSIEMT